MTVHATNYGAGDPVFSARALWSALGQGAIRERKRCDGRDENPLFAEAQHLKSISLTQLQLQVFGLPGD